MRAFHSKHLDFGSGEFGSHFRLWHFSLETFTPKSKPPFTFAGGNLFFGLFGKAFFFKTTGE